MVLPPEEKLRLLSMVDIVETLKRVADQGLLRVDGVLRSSQPSSLPLERHYSSTAMASISTSCPSIASMDTPNSVLAAPAMPDSCTAPHTTPRSARSPATT
jgi:hypothetical protein